MEKFEIRKFELRDLQSVYDLLNKLYEGKIKFDIFSKLYEEKLNDNFSYNIVYVLNGIIVGVLVSELSYKLHRAKKCSFIDDIIVEENHRSRGIVF